MTITAISTQGSQGTPDWVETYQVYYSIDGDTYHYIVDEQDNPKVSLKRHNLYVRHLILCLHSVYLNEM